MDPSSESRPNYLAISGSPIQVQERAKVSLLCSLLLFLAMRLSRKHCVRPAHIVLSGAILVLLPLALGLPGIVSRHGDLDLRARLIFGTWPGLLVLAPLLSPGLRQATC